MFWSTATHMTVDLETSQIENWKFDESLDEISTFYIFTTGKVFTAPWCSTCKK